jgi:hypothetical protein
MLFLTFHMIEELNSRCPTANSSLISAIVVFGPLLFFFLNDASKTEPNQTLSTQSMQSKC